MAGSETVETGKAHTFYEIAFEEYYISTVGEDVEWDTRLVGDTHGSSEEYGDERWIYVFKFIPSTYEAEIVDELQVKVGQSDWGTGYQTKYERVDWSDRTRWRDEDVRSPTETLDTYCRTFDAEAANLRIFLSEIQLPYQRIKTYEENASRLNLRAMWSEYSEEGSERMAVKLHNRLKELRHLQSEYLTLQEELEKEAPDKDTTARYHLAMLTKSLASSVAETENTQRTGWKGMPTRVEPEVWSWVRKDDLQAFIDKTEPTFERVDNLETQVQHLAVWKMKLMLRPDFREVQRDYDSREALQDEIIETSAYLIQDSHKSEATRKFLMQIADDENNWYVRLLLDDELFGTGKKTYSTARGIAEHVLTIYKQWAMAAIKKQRKVRQLLRKYSSAPSSNTLQEIADVLERRVDDLGSAFNKLPDGKYFSVVRPGEKLPNVVRFALKTEATDVITENKRLIDRLRKHQASFSRITTHITLALSFVNIVHATRKLEEANRTEGEWDDATEWVGFANATGELMEGTRFLLSRKLGMKFFKRVGVITGVLGFAYDAMRAPAAYAEGKVGVGVGHTVSAVGSLLLLAGSAGLMGVGLLIVFGGMLVVNACQDGPIETWLKNSPWGTHHPNAGVDASKFTTHVIIAQTEKYYALVASFTIDVSDSAEKRIKVSVEPGMLTEGSELLINLTLQGPLLTQREMREIEDVRMVEVPREKTYVVEEDWDMLRRQERVTVERDEGRIKKVERSWSRSELARVVTDAPLSLHFKYEVTARLDLMGDSRFLIPRNDTITRTGRI